ncbi:MAG: enoyl-CoA hydratase/isomerase family protein [Actinobacteria bacterium]|nr:MAG: enoyl-CoA hydratase/isomerase family protein [Actinomycetota bacterium]
MPAPPENRPTLVRERRAAGVEVLRLDRPERRNALDSRALAELERALAELGADPELSVLVLSTTSSRALCAGADVEEPLDRAGGVARMEAFSRMYAAVEAFPAPTVCVCVGNCVGAGAELAAGCDLRVGGENLKLAWAGARLGVPVGVARLVPLVGLAIAKEQVFTGRTVGCEEALRHGLRRLKRMFRDFEGTAGRVAAENAILEAWQRGGPGLPSRPADERRADPERG